MQIASVSLLAHMDEDDWDEAVVDNIGDEITDEVSNELWSLLEDMKRLLEGRKWPHGFSVQFEIDS